MNSEREMKCSVSKFTRLRSRAEAKVLLRVIEGKVLELRWFLENKPSENMLLSHESAVRKKWVECCRKSVNAERSNQLMGSLYALGWLRGEDDLV